MDHLAHVIEAMLAIAGAMRFCHELVELAHMAVKMMKLVKK